jgi:DNA gyrase subunit A
MHELGLTPDRPFRKCARVVGDVLGKYHPHGDQSVYEALVRMVQDFSSRYPLLAGHGNFGSVDNDPPAAMRYTETRLSPIGHHAMLGDISEAIVDFTSNFDNSQQEPVVLPAQLPFLLLNGCSGIAVGMATNIPPHNLGELVDGAIALIDNPQVPDEKLWAMIPGPDFPTGGEIIDSEGIREAYRTGRGLIPVRGVAKIEKIYLERRRHKERTAIVVSELPYQVNKAAWIEKVAELVNQGKLEGIADIRDESDRQGMRVVIELKRDINPQTVLGELYQQTALQTNFGAILLALVDNKPCQLSLRSLLEEFLKFREQTLTRQYRHLLEQAQHRRHLVEGLLMALHNLDEAIAILRNAPDGSSAKQRFQEELGISESQADAILAMPLRRLTGLERQKLQAECDELQAQVQQLQLLLSDRHELMKALKKELRSLKRQFDNQRRTRIAQKIGAQALRPENEGGRGDAEIGRRGDRETRGRGEIDTRKNVTPKDKSKESPAPTLQLFTPQAPPEDALLEITYPGYVSWRSPSSQQGKGAVIYRETIGKQEHFIVITNTGKAYRVPVNEIPPVGNPCQTLTRLLPKSAQQSQEHPIAHFFLPPSAQHSDLILLTQKGRIKRLPLEELSQLTSRGLALIKLKEEDRLSYVGWGREGQQVAIATTGGRVLRVAIGDAQFPIMGRSAQGNPALRLRYGEHLAGFVCLQENDTLLLVSQRGYGKRLPLSSLRLANLGDIGTQALQFTSKTDRLATAILATAATHFTLLTTAHRWLSLAVDSVSLWGKDGSGDPLADLQPEEVICLAIAHCQGEKT